MKKIIFISLLSLVYVISGNAQVAYQVSLLNSATGEPRANVTVNAHVEITDVTGGTVYSGSQSATTNDFGVLSLTVGSDGMFKDAAMGKLPLYIAVTVDGVLIGKTQILNVPVAEVAKTLASDFTKEELCKTWTFSGETFTFGDGTFSCQRVKVDRTITFSGVYYVVGNVIYAVVTQADDPNKLKDFFLFMWVNGELYTINK